MIGVVVFTIMPLVYMISLAFTNYDHEHLPPRNLFGWVGFVNFKNVLNGDISSTFFPVLGWTLIWALLATATCFFLAYCLHFLLIIRVLNSKVLAHYLCYNYGGTSVCVTSRNAELVACSRTA